MSIFNNDDKKSVNLSDDEYVDYPVQIEESSSVDAVKDQSTDYSAKLSNLKPSIISEGFSFTGEIKAPGGFLTVDGNLQGIVELQNLIVGNAGSVNGTLVAESITVKGELMGQLTTNELMVGPQALIDGKVTYKSITIQRGGTIKGELKRS